MTQVSHTGMATLGKRAPRPGQDAVPGQTPRPASLRGAWTLGTVSFIFYLFIIHSFKINAAQITLIIGIVGVLLMSRPLRLSSSMKWFGFYLLWALVTLPMSVNVPVSWGAWTTAFKVWLIMFLAYNAIKTQGQVRLVLLAWLAMFAFYPVRGTLFNFVGGNSSFGRYAWNFSFSNFNDLAALTLLPMGMAVDRLRSAEAKWIRICALAGLLILPFVILITQSRGGMLGMAAFFLFLFARSRYRLRLMVAAAATSIGAVIFAPQSVWDRIVNMKYLTSTQTLDQSDSSADQRWTILQVALSVSANNPLFGVGIGAYPYAHVRYAQKRPEWAGARGTRDAHNTYVHVFAETGIIGFALLAMVFGTAYNELRLTRKQLKGSPLASDRELADRCQAFQASLVGLSVCAIFGSLDNMSYPYLFITVAVAATQIARVNVARSATSIIKKRRPAFSSGLRIQPRAIVR